MADLVREGRSPQAYEGCAGGRAANALFARVALYGRLVAIATIAP